MSTMLAAPHDPAQWGGIREGIITVLGTGLGAAYAVWGIRSMAPSMTIEVLGPAPRGVAGAVWARTNPSVYELPEHRIHVSLTGKADSYSLKQWGVLTETSAHRNLEKSMVVETGFDPAQFMRKTFLAFQPRNAMFREQHEVAELAKQRVAVIQTFSLDFRLNQQLVRIPVVLHPTTITDNYCVYNGIEGDPVVRESCLFGHMYYELSSLAEQKAIDSVAAGVEGRQVVYPPNIPPWCEVEPLTWQQRRPQPNVLLVGRYPQFDPKHLAHHAYEDVRKFLGELLYGQ